MNEEQKIALLKLIFKTTCSKKTNRRIFDDSSIRPETLSDIYRIDVDKTLAKVTELFANHWNTEEINHRIERRMLIGIIKSSYAEQREDQVYITYYETENDLFKQCLRYLDLNDTEGVLLNSFDEKFNRPHYNKYETNYRKWLKLINYLDLNEKLIEEADATPTLVKLSMNAILKESNLEEFPIRQLKKSLNELGLNFDKERLHKIHNKILQEASELSNSLLVDLDSTYAQNQITGLKRSNSEIEEQSINKKMKTNESDLNFI